MKKYMKHCLCLLACYIFLSCAKDKLWLDDSLVERANITGQLINTDNGLPFQGVKLLFERQVQHDGEHTKIDTISTDSEGKFSYAIPFPNKVRVLVQDTGRYVADTVVMVVEEKKDYQINLATYPRFGVTQVEVDVFDTYLDAVAVDAPVSLWVRQSNKESFSLVETLLANGSGKVKFENIAWPVDYRVRIEDDVHRYDQDSVLGMIRTKNLVSLSLNTSKLFGSSTPVSIKPIDKNNSSALLPNLAFSIFYNNPDNGELVEKRIVTGMDGMATVSLPYPINARFELEENDSFFPIVVDTLVKRGSNVFELELDAIPITTTLMVNLTGGIQTAGTLFNVYQKLPSSSTYSLLGVYTVDALGKITIADIAYPKDIKIENKYNLGYLGNVQKVISVPSYKPVTENWNFESPDRYMLFGQPAATTARAKLSYADLGIYNDPTIFGNASQVSVDLTFQIKVKIASKGTNNPAIGGTVTHYNANDGGTNEGFGFMHGGHSNAECQWRFKYGASMISSNNSAALTNGEWVALTAIIRKTGATTRTVTLYTNNDVASSVYNLAANRTAVAASSSADLLFGGNPNQYGSGNISHYVKDFRIYTRALSTAEIANYCSDFISPNDLIDPLLIGYWPMNDGSTGRFKNYSPDVRALGKDIIITTAKELTKVPRKCN